MEFYNEVMLLEACLTHTLKCPIICNTNVTDDQRCEVDDHL